MRLLKQFRIKQLEEAKGEVTAAIATLNVKDHDGDVTLPGAFGTQEVAIVPSHDWKSVPLGRATISEKGEEVIAKMRFNLDTEAGSEWFKALQFDFKSGKPLQEYSYGYEIVKADKGEKDGEKVQFLKELKVVEVSPVLLGAGINTRTLDVKNLSRKAYVEVAGSWEAIQRALRAAARRELNDDYCYLEATLDDSVIVVSYREWAGGEWKETYYQFDWTIGESGLALSNRREVQLDAVVTVKSLTYADHFDSLVGDFKHFECRSKALAALRGKSGRALSQANRDRLSQLLGLITDARGGLESFLAETSTETAGSAEDGKSFAAFMEASTKIAALGRR